MSVAYFESLDECDLIEVVFIGFRGEEKSIRLLVDSGFTGVSEFVLSTDLRDFGLANLSSAHAAGALSGRQERTLVRCRIPSIPFDESSSAILADLRPLSLPRGVQGMAGLAFLRRFSRWGSERADGNGWRFFVDTGQK